ncbi:hypothetical protein SK128_018531 [Halocaridina rubra]|uniref:Uncharacterized protein n=1 Tax=Halocaridina rubra TaxID=373956 RepID=A0AAN8WTG6_HALRR
MRSKTLTVKNNYRRGFQDTEDAPMEGSPEIFNQFSSSVDMESEFDIISSAVVGSANGNRSSSIPNLMGHHVNQNNINQQVVPPTFSSLQHRRSDGSFQLSQVQSQERAARGPMTENNNMDDLRVEEITS